MVLAFLYSHCGAPCVLIAQQIRGALDELASRPAPGAVIVSADPAGDTPAAVRRFLARGLAERPRLLPDRHAAAARDASGGLRSHARASAGAATFAKYATVRLIDAEGRERVLYGAEQLTPEALAHDIGKLAGRLIP